MIQLPIVFAGFAAGSVAGAHVGLFGALVMALTMAKPNPYRIVRNAILVFLTGLSYSRMRRFSRRIVIPQMASVLSAYALQLPLIYIADAYLMGVPHVVVMGIIGVLLIEDLISILISHAILYRVDVNRLLIG